VREVARNFPHPRRIACCSAPNSLPPATKALHTIRGNNISIVSSSWRWAYECQKHVERIIIAIKHSVASSWFSSLRLYRTILKISVGGGERGERNIFWCGEVWKSVVCWISQITVFFKHMRLIFYGFLWSATDFTVCFLAIKKWNSLLIFFLSYKFSPPCPLLCLSSTRRQHSFFPRISFSRLSCYVHGLPNV